MTSVDTTAPTLADRLAAPITLAEPDLVGPLAVFPLITAAAPKVEYVAFAEACGRGVALKELSDGASVNDLIVHNPTDLAVLLYEGEEVLGAQQNRTFDVSVLVAAGTSLPVPVSCVEQGRWDHRRHDESFAPAPHAAHPQLRRLKNERVREALAGGAAPRADQHEVWAEVAAKSTRHGVASDTGALHDVFENRRAPPGTRRPRDRHEVQPGRDARRDRRALRGPRLRQRRRGVRGAARSARRRLRPRCARRPRHRRG